MSDTVVTRATTDRPPLRSRAERLRGLVAVRRGTLELLPACAVFFAFACFLTWPLITDLGHYFYAQSPAGDPYGTMSFFRELVDHGHNPFLPGTVSQLAAPEGQPIPWARDLAAMPSILVQFSLTAVFHQVAANGLYILLGYFLSSLTMFLFVRRLTGNAWAGLISGWAFGFFPFAVLNGQGHTDYIHGWVLVLAVWRLIELQWAPTRRNALFAGLAVALALWWTPYFILLGGVTYAVVLVVSLALASYAHAVRPMLRAHALTAVIVVVLAAALVALAASATGGGAGVRTNALPEFVTYSARPLEYLLPDQHSPIFGGLTGPYLAAHLHGSNVTESTLYIGVTVLALALVAGVFLLLRRLTARLDQAVVILAAIAVVALICSAPPEANILGLTVPFPSHFIMKVTTTWRAYSRFVVVVMLAVTALAGIGLNALTAGRTKWVRVGIMLAASILVPLDLWARLPHRTDTYDVPAVYRALAHQSPGLAAEYPLTPAGYNFYADVFFQNVHGMPMINGYLSGSTQERRALTLTNLSDPRTASHLASLGVRYVIREAGATPYGLPSAGTPGRGFRLLHRDSFASLYVVTAKPSGPALPAAADGFADDEVTPTGTTFNWLEQPTGTIELSGRCHPCDGVLHMTVAPFTKARLITISVGGHVLAVRSVFRPTPLSIPLKFDSHQTVTIAATPGPQSIAKTLGGPDTRSVSIQVANLEFVWPPGHDGSTPQG